MIFVVGSAEDSVKNRLPFQGVACRGTGSVGGSIIKTASPQKWLCCNISNHDTRVVRFKYDDTFKFEVA